MKQNKHYSIRPRPVGQYASALEASWALHLRSMCESVEYTGATSKSFDFLVTTGDRVIAVEVKPQLNNDDSGASDKHGIPDIVYSAASRSYRKQVEQTSRRGLIATLIATGYPESAKWYLVLCESEDRRYRHRHMRGSKRWGDDINTRSLSDYTIYVLDSAPQFGEHLLEWVTHAVNVFMLVHVDVVDPKPLDHRAQQLVSDKQKRKLQNRARQAARCRQHG